MVTMQGPFRLFLIFQKFIYLGVRRPFLGQNLPQIRDFHKVGGDIRLVESRQDLRFQMRLLGTF